MSKYIKEMNEEITAFNCYIPHSETGKIGMWSENAINKRIPVQNTGAAYPNRENIFTKDLIVHLGFEQRNSKSMPTNKDNICAEKTNNKVAGNLSIIKSNTGKL